MSIAEEQLRRDLRTVLDGALCAVAPDLLVERELRRRAPLAPRGRVALVAFGKAADGMARGAWRALGDRIGRGVVVVPHGCETRGPERFACMRAGHPLPDDASVDAARAVLDLAASCAREDLLLCLVSGGGSSLVTFPADGHSLAELRRTGERLLRSGAGIREINRERRRSDLVKGGGLARAARAATVLGLVLSDVVGDAVADVASGPLSPADGDPLPASRVETVVVGNGRLAVDGARRTAEGLGYATHVHSTGLVGEARDAGARLARVVRGVRRRGEPVRPPACVLAAGETTVTVRGPGLGGRNQELVLGAVAELDGEPDVLLASVGTDGVDGPTEAAGALATGLTLRRGAAAGLDLRSALERNDSHAWFEALGDRVVTGPTGTNVADLQIALIG